MTFRSLIAIASVFVLTCLARTGWGQERSADEGEKFFESKVRPILVKRCYECHSEQAGKRKGGLWLDRKAGWVQGGDSGEAVVPGNPDDSLLIYSVRYEDSSLAMPPKGRLPKEEIAILEKWVVIGAPDPRDKKLTETIRHGAIDYESARKNWAFRPLLQSDLPKIDNANWSTTSIDRFLFHEMLAEELQPAALVSPRALVRRLYFDLSGLPPTKAEVDAFVKDPGDAAYARLVDKLLGQKSFGEKWGKHWLDVARYADSNGGDRNFTFYQAWRYRNYVIDAFNNDKSWYDFVREQIAGDLLPAGSDAQRREQLIASTFLALGPKMLTERDKEKLQLDTVDEQIDTTGRAFLGLTIGCARCHDHKFDPISQRDYYALAGIFGSTQVVMGTRNGCVNVASWVEQPLPGKKQKELAKDVARLELAMRLTVEKVYNEKSGNKPKTKSGPKLSTLPLAGIIADNAQAELVGKWRASSLSPNRYGPTYSVSEGAKDEAIFRASVPETGEYEVRIAYPAESNRCKNVPVVVTNHTGEHSIKLDETKTPRVAGLFQPIGRFVFEKDNTCRVTIRSARTKGFVIVDAVQFIPVADIEREQHALKNSGVETNSLANMSSGELKKEISRLINKLRTADLAMAPRDVKSPTDMHLRIRGEVSQPGPKIPRGFPKLLTDGTETLPNAKSSGRLELANWLVRPQNSLLDRVIVNRVWHHLFGRGIVTTVDNFGRLGTPPTHPELLDWLAAELRASGGSVKSLIREIVLSRAYRQSCDGPSTEADPRNQFFARQNRRRLSAEEIRDSILFLAGELDTSSGKATATPFGTDLDKPIDFTKKKIRTVYLPVARNNAVAEMTLFDAANPDLVDGRRPETNVPTQALYLLNSEFVQQRAQQIAAQRPTNAGVEWLYETVLSRTPTDAEHERAAAFIQATAGEEPSPESLQTAYGHFAHLLIASTEFLFVE